MQPTNGGPQPNQNTQAPMISAAKQAAENATQLGGEEDLGPEALQPGKTGDNAKFLIGAIQNLHNYIGSLTDANVQGMVRNLIGVITKLIEHDQEYAGTQLAEQMKASGGAQAQTPVQIGETPLSIGGAPAEAGGEENMLGGGQIQVPQPPSLE